ncbi:DsbA family oxidoreductase [Pseudomonas boanensis]|uniref:DsbA family oxidoreductase n=1 Tax=Metapseudomonas boanensis TaxID=2822138 RepID=UPI0035D520D5
MKPLLIEVAFDFICPWCLIGKRNLERALKLLAASRPGVPVRVLWRGVQLLPDLPAEGVPFGEFYARRLGSEAAVLARQAQVKAAAALAGADVDLHRIRVMPNTANAHRLFARAAEIGTEEQVNALLERLFAAYFQSGDDLGQQELLLRLAQSCDFDPRDLADVLHDDATPYSGDFASLGVSGVPAFVVDQRYPLVGAQPPEMILATLLRAMPSPELQA